MNVKIVIVIIFLNALSQSISAQTIKDFSWQSNLKARQIVEASVEAFGGQKALVRARNFSLKLNGRAIQLFQSRDPESPHFPMAAETTIIIETNRNRLFHERAFKSPVSDFVSHRKTVVNDGAGFTVFFPDKWVIKETSDSVANYQGLYRLLPQNILSEILLRKSSLRWLGKDELGGRQQDVVAFTFRNGGIWNLFFDSKTMLLTKYTRFYTRNTLGDTKAEGIFEGYRDSQGTKIPTSLRRYHRGAMSADIRYKEVTFDPKIDDSVYDLPKDSVELNVTKPKAEVRKIAENVYLVASLAGGYNALAVEFKDFILAVEAPEQNSVRRGISSQMIDLIKKAIPNKPIKYSVFTHHHGDHSSGVRAFVSEGARVIATPGNVKYLNRLVNARFTFAPDLLAKNPNKLILEVIKKNKRVVSDSANTAEIYQIGPILHSKEMLVIYLPKQKILFQSDLFNPIKPDIISTDVAPWHGVDKLNMLSLYNAIQKLGLDVKTIVGSHGRLSTFRELVEDVKKLEKEKKKHE